ncbi:MAG: hypothetical protein ACSLE0_23240 [Chitinophagaceae bacterium]
MENEPRNLMEDIDAFLKELTESKKKLEGKFRLVSGCKTNGIIELDLDKLCNDPECTTCRSFENAFREEVKKWRTPEKTIDLNKIK